MAVAEAVRRNNHVSEWLAFATQMLIAVSIEVGDDVGRGFFSQHGTARGIAGGRDVISFEAAHGFWVEPAWQMFFMQTRRILTFTLTWSDWQHVMNGIYIFGHIFVTVGVALWVYVYRRQFFGLLRNVLILANIIALLVYEAFPVAPPRMIGDVHFDGRLFAFQDTLNGIINSGQKLVGTHAAGYNEFSAMPSIHMAWALLVGVALVLLAQPLWAKALGIIYPCMMLVAVVVTGNHYILDAVGSGLVLMVAGALAVAFECWRGQAPWRLNRSGVPATSR